MQVLHHTFCSKPHQYKLPDTANVTACLLAATHAKRLFAHKNQESSTLLRDVWCEFILLNTLCFSVALGLVSVTHKSMTHQWREETFCLNLLFHLISAFPPSPPPRGESNFWARELNFHWRKTLATCNQNWKNVTTYGLFWIKKTGTLT